MLSETWTIILILGFIALVLVFIVDIYKINKATNKHTKIPFKEDNKRLKN